MVIVVMGVSGCGKTTVGRALAERLGRPFQEGDALHPPENVAKMASGTPLSDADRAPWLEAVAAWIDSQFAALEEPGSDEQPIVVDTSRSIDEVVAAVTARVA